MNVKTIDINAYEWFDRINGNSYFAGKVTINYGMEDQTEIIMPFQYGYGNQYEWEAKTQLEEKGFIKKSNNNISTYCREHKIILRSNKQRNCKKRDLVNLGK